MVTLMDIQALWSTIQRQFYKNHVGCDQSDQKKIAKCLQNLPKNDFTTNMIDFDTFTKIA